jgi:hypothetical protein
MLSGKGETDNVTNYYDQRNIYLLEQGTVH